MCSMNTCVCVCSTTIFGENHVFNKIALVLLKLHDETSQKENIIALIKNKRGGSLANYIVTQSFY